MAFGATHAGRPCLRSELPQRRCSCFPAASGLVSLTLASRLRVRRLKPQIKDEAVVKVEKAKLKAEDRAQNVNRKKKGRK